MTNIGDILVGLNDLPIEGFSTGDKEVVYKAIDFFEELPSDLDLASAAYYLKKEFKRNDAGVDDRIQIFTFDPEPVDDEGYWDSSGYDLDDDYDEDASWREDYY